MRVLVVDDNWDIRLLIGIVLRRLEAEMIPASSGPQALELLRSGPLPDLVLLDIQMPVMDGWDTLTAIRADERAKDLPVVLCTVKASPADNLRGWTLGCDGYISKPFRIAELRQIVLDVSRRTVTEREAARRNAVQRSEVTVRHEGETA
jgi:CheY-like chemotaxis protein